MWQSDLVFGSGVGTPINPRNLYRSFKAILEQAGLPDVRFHDLRHTAATLMLAADGRVMVVLEGDQL